MPVKAPGSDWDINGCITSAGYVWCEILGKCLRTWEQACQYPTNCLTWYDGCNTCMLVEGEEGMTLGGCTEMYCFQQATPYCMVQTPEMVIDPMPPLVNPFLTPIADGH